MLTLITGASSGIGRELAHFAAHDGDVIITARRRAELESLAEELPCTAHIVIADLASDGVEVILEYIDDNELHVDQLINNAGFGGMGAFHQRSWQADMAMMEVNMNALTHLSKMLVPQMVSKGAGRVLNVASIAGFITGPGQAVYYATKAYVVSLSQAMSEELRGTGVTVTALCPGPVATEFAQVADMEKTGLFKRAPSAEKVAAYGYKAMQKGKVVAIQGFKNKASVFAMRFVPRGMLRKISRKALS